MGHKGHIFTNVQGLTEALIIGQFLPKRYQKKRYLMGYKSLKEFLKNIWLSINSRPAKIRSVHAYEVIWIQ